MDYCAAGNFLRVKYATGPQRSASHCKTNCECWPPVYILVNRVYSTVEDLRDGSESAWSHAGQYTWVTPSLKVALFVLT